MCFIYRYWFVNNLHVWTLTILLSISVLLILWFLLFLYLIRTSTLEFELLFLSKQIPTFHLYPIILSSSIISLFFTLLLSILLLLIDHYLFFNYSMFQPIHYPMKDLIHLLISLGHLLKHDILASLEASRWVPHRILVLVFRDTFETCQSLTTLTTPWVLCQKPTQLA